MEAVARLDALGGDPGADHLAEPVEVHRRATPQGLQLRAHRLGPRLGSEEAVGEPDVARVHPLLEHALPDVQREGGRAGEPVGAKILEEQDLAQGVAGGHRHHREPHVLGAVVEAEAAGEEAVAVGDLHELAGLCAGGGQRTRHHLAPHLEVAPGVADHGGLAARARRGVDAHQVLAGDREEPERVVIAQVLLAGERQLPEPLEVDLPVAHAGLREGVLVEGHPRPRPGHGGAQPLGLQRAQGGARRGLDVAVPDHRRPPLMALRSPPPGARASSAARGSAPWSRGCAGRRRRRD